MKKMITLISSDNERFEVSAAAASLSGVIRSSIECGAAAAGGIPLPKVTGKVLAKVIEYCNKHAAAAGSSKSKTGTSSSSSAVAGAAAAHQGETAGSKELKSFDEAFIVVDTDTLYDLITAANFLEVKGLVDLASQKVADMISGKTTEEIRKIFQLKNDMTEEEKEEEEMLTVWDF